MSPQAKVKLWMIACGLVAWVSGAWVGVHVGYELGVEDGRGQVIDR